MFSWFVFKLSDSPSFLYLHICCAFVVSSSRLRLRVKAIMLVGFASWNQRKQMPIWFPYLFQELPTCVLRTFFSKIVKYLEELRVLFAGGYKVPRDNLGWPFLFALFVPSGRLSQVSLHRASQGPFLWWPEALVTWYILLLIRLFTPCATLVPPRLPRSCPPVCHLRFLCVRITRPSLRTVHVCKTLAVLGLLCWSYKWLWNFAPLNVLVTDEQQIFRYYLL